MFRDTLDAVSRQSVQLTPYLRNNTLLHQWVLGQVQIMSLLEDEEEWEDNDCVYCSIAHVLRLQSCFPWMATLRFMGETAAYHRSLRFLQYDGEEVEGMEKWIDQLCRDVGMQTD